MYCTHCGNEVRIKDEFCSKCGAKTRPFDSTQTSAATVSSKVEIGVVDDVSGSSASEIMDYNPASHEEEYLGWKQLSAYDKFCNLFNGRLGRKAFVTIWPLPILGNQVLVAVISVEIDSLLDTEPFLVPILLISLLYPVLAPVSIVMALSIGIRRIHDIGHSGWWLLLLCLAWGGQQALVILIGFAFVLYLQIKPKQLAVNEYGDVQGFSSYTDALLNKRLSRESHERMPKTKKVVTITLALLVALWVLVGWSILFD